MLDGELPSDQDLLNLGIKAYTQSDIDNAANKDTIEDAKKYLIGAPKVWPRMKKLSLNLNFMNGKLPDWILYHPYLSFWDPFTMIFQQELSTTSSKAKNTKGESTDKNQTKKKETTIKADSDDYIIPDSSTRLITEEDINGLNNDELCLARNEIYARKGRKFKDDDIRQYFESKDWYNPTIEADDFTNDMLSDIEKKNVEFIKSYED